MIRAEAFGVEELLSDCDSLRRIEETETTRAGGAQQIRRFRHSRSSGGFEEPGLDRRTRRREERQL